MLLTELIRENFRNSKLKQCLLPPLGELLYLIASKVRLPSDPYKFNKCEKICFGNIDKESKLFCHWDPQQFLVLVCSVVLFLLTFFLKENPFIKLFIFLLCTYSPSEYCSVVGLLLLIKLQNSSTE